MSAAPTPELVAWVQGGYFLVTGIWPLVSIGTFERVTGPKVDRWLVKTVGVLVTVIGIVLVVATRDEISLAIRMLAIGSALGLAAIDVVYAMKGVIAKIYLADAVVEVLLVAAWLVATQA